MADDRSGGFLESPEHWVAIGFIVFLAFAGKKLWRALADKLDRHSETAARQLDQAARLRKEAEALLADAKRQFENARLEAERLSSETQATAAQLRDRLQAELETALARRQKAALDKIAQAEARALAEVKAETIRITIEATGNLLAAQIDDAVAGALVDRAISELPDRFD